MVTRFYNLSHLGYIHRVNTASEGVRLTWHIARFMCGLEEKAARALDCGPDDYSPDEYDPVGAAFCPLERHVWVAQGRKREMIRPVISGCVFVEGARDPRRWHNIAETEGFIGFLGADQAYPDPVRMGEVAYWRARAGATWVVDFEDRSVVEDPLERGDVVRLRQAADADIDLYRTIEMARFVFGGNPDVTGVVEWVQGDGTAWVTFRGLFNQETKISISARALERVVVESKRQRARLTVVR